MRCQHETRVLGLADRRFRSPQQASGRAASPASAAFYEDDAGVIDAVRTRPSQRKERDDKMDQAHRVAQALREHTHQ